jgi:hypothetical protein
MRPRDRLLRYVLAGSFLATPGATQGASARTPADCTSARLQAKLLRVFFAKLLCLVLGARATG